MGDVVIFAMAACFLVVWCALLVTRPHNRRVVAAALDRAVPPPSVGVEHTFDRSTSTSVPAPVRRGLVTDPLAHVTVDADVLFIDAGLSPTWLGRGDVIAVEAFPIWPRRQVIRFVGPRGHPYDLLASTGGRPGTGALLDALRAHGWPVVGPPPSPPRGARHL